MKESRRLINSMKDLGKEKEALKTTKRGSALIQRSSISQTNSGIRSKSIIGVDSIKRKASIGASSKKDSTNSLVFNTKKPNQRSGSVIKNGVGKNDLNASVNSNQTSNLNNVINESFANPAGTYTKNDSNRSIGLSRKAPERKKTMKIQCHLDLIDDIKKATDLPVTNDHMPINNALSPEKNKQATMNSSHYNLYKILSDASAPKGGSLNNSTENITTGSYSQQQSTENELHLQNYRKDNNIVVPKKQYFNAFKSLFDYSKIESFDIFDYNDSSSQIKYIQTAYRAFRSRKKYKVYRYCIRRIMMVQRLVRGISTRKKFRKFVYCHNCIVFIQRLYKMRHEKKDEAITKLQTNWRSKKAWEKYMNKLERKQFMENNSDGDYQDDEEDAVNFSGLGNMTHISTQARKSVNKDFETELLNVSVKTEKKKTQGNQPVSRARLSIVQLENETDKNKIIDHLLMDETLHMKNTNTIVEKSLLQKAGITNRLKQNIEHLTRVRKVVPRPGKRVNN